MRTGLLLLLPAALGVAAGPAGPRFDRAVALETVSEATANASLGDVNGDGHLDVVLAKGRHWPLVDVVLLNDGKGGFGQRHSLGDKADRSYRAALADLDTDGDLDVVVGNDEPDEKVVYFGDGRGQFSPAGTFGEARWPTRNVTLADVTGDRVPDIVVANRGPVDNSANYVCPNDGRGHFPNCAVLSTAPATTIAAGDLDGDGAVDLVVPHRDGGQSYLFLNDGKGGFARKRPFGAAKSATRAVALGDLDGDGRLDIVAGDEIRGGALVYFNRAGAFSAPLRIASKPDTAYSIAIADLDRDGDADVIVGNADSPGAILLNDGKGTHFTLSRFGDKQGAVYGLAIGDVDGDGWPDIVAARSDAPSMLYPGSPARPDALGLLPAEVRESATVVLTGRFRVGRGPCEHLPDGSRRWALLRGFTPTAVHRGDVRNDYVGVADPHILGTDDALLEGEQYLVALRPSRASLAALRKLQGGRHSGQALPPEEVLAIVSLSGRRPDARD